MRDNSYRKIVYTFKFYDKLKKKWCKSNATTWRAAEQYRQILSLEDRYCFISEVYERDISKPNTY